MSNVGNLTVLMQFRSQAVRITRSAGALARNEPEARRMSEDTVVYV